MTTWIVILAVAVGTYALRASMFIVVGRRTLPSWSDVPMSFVAPAAMAALTMSMLFTSRSGIAAPALAELAAITGGFLVVRRTGNICHAFLVGMPIYWVLQLVVA